MTRALAEAVVSAAGSDDPAVVLVTGTSGVGTTSLLRAGLLGHGRPAPFGGEARWPSVYVNAAAAYSPLMDLTAKLAAIGRMPDSRALTERLALPMDRIRQPKTPTKLVPVMREDDTAKVLDACKGKGFAGLRDEALIRLYANTGARL